MMSTTSAANAQVVEHTTATYDTADNAATHVRSEKLPAYDLKPKNERGR